MLKIYFRNECRYPIFMFSNFDIIVSDSFFMHWMSAKKIEKKVVMIYSFCCSIVLLGKLAFTYQPRLCEILCRQSCLNDKVFFVVTIYGRIRFFRVRYS